ncbi:MAG: hypothetical protein R3F60_00300 [bacterium]
MRSDKILTVPRWTALLPLAAWGFVLLQKIELGRPATMLWGCHVATLLLALGLGLRRRGLVEIATLYHVAAGLPGWLIDWIVVGETTISSVISHVLTPTLGLWALRGRIGPAGLAGALALHAALLPVSAWLTPARLNVNQAFRVWGPARAWLPDHPAAAWGASLVVTGAALALGWWVLGQVARRRRIS